MFDQIFVDWLIQLHQHTYGPTHDFINGTWSQTYGAINTVNELIEYDPGDPDDVELDANQLAQARALRAYFYFRLLDLYGRVKIY